MENNYDEIQIEYLETKNVSPFLKFTVIILVLFFAFVPMAEFVNGFDYNQSFSPSIHFCGSDLIELFQAQPLQFKSLPPLN